MGDVAKEPLDIDLDFPVFPESPARPTRKVNYLSWLEEIEPFRRMFETEFGERFPRRGGWDESFTL